MAEAIVHIGVDGRELLGNPTGVGRYLRNVLLQWDLSAGADGASRRVSVFLPSEPPPELRSTARTIRWQVEEDGRGGTWWEQTRLRSAIATSGVDVFFAAGYTAPLRMPCPFVVAIYDVSFFAHPGWFSRREGLRRRLLTRRAAHRASSVVTISEFSAAEIVRWLKVSRDRILLAPPGAPTPISAPPLRSREPLVLFVGSLFTRRHLPDLIRGFAEARRRVPDARLVLVGDNRTRPSIDPLRIAASCGVADAVEWRAYASEAELGRLYGTARVFAFVSDYEGFAMTPMEAIASGAPAVVADTPVSREVYGPGAWLVAPAPRSIADALVTLLTDDGAHAALLEAGQARLALFSWDRTAAAILRALQKAARGS